MRQTDIKTRVGLSGISNRYKRMRMKRNQNKRARLGAERTSDRVRVRTSLNYHRQDKRGIHMGNEQMR